MKLNNIETSIWVKGYIIMTPTFIIYLFDFKGLCKKLDVVPIPGVNCFNILMCIRNMNFDSLRKKQKIRYL